MSLFKHIKFSCGTILEIPSTGTYRNRLLNSRPVKSAKRYILNPTVKIKYAS